MSSLLEEIHLKPFTAPFHCGFVFRLSWGSPYSLSGASPQGKTTRKFYQLLVTLGLTRSKIGCTRIV